MVVHSITPVISWLLTVSHLWLLTVSNLWLLTVSHLWSVDYWQYHTCGYWQHVFTVRLLYVLAQLWQLVPWCRLQSVVADDAGRRCIRPPAAAAAAAAAWLYSDISEGWIQWSFQLQTCSQAAVIDGRLQGQQWALTGWTSLMSYIVCQLSAYFVTCNCFKFLDTPTTFFTKSGREVSVCTVIKLKKKITIKCIVINTVTLSVGSNVLQNKTNALQ